MSHDDSGDDPTGESTGDTTTAGPADDVTRSDATDTSDAEAATDTAVTSEGDEAIDGPPTAEAAVPETRAETALGIDANLAAAIAYLFGFVTGAIVFVLEDENEFVRFHAAQSIVVSVVVFVGYFGVTFGAWMLGFFLEFIPGIGGILSLMVSLLMFILMPLLGLAILGLYLFMMYKAYSEERWRVPVLGKIAEENLL